MNGMQELCAYETKQAICLKRAECDKQLKGITFDAVLCGNHAKLDHKAGTLLYSVDVKCWRAMPDIDDKTMKEMRIFWSHKDAR